MLTGHYNFNCVGIWKAGLADHDNYHEFCRLLGRFRVNYQVVLCIVFLLLWSIYWFLFLIGSNTMCISRDMGFMQWRLGTYFGLEVRRALYCVQHTNWPL